MHFRTLACVMAAAAAPALASHAALFNQVTTFGSANLTTPGTAASFDAAGNFYITDFSTHAVNVFDANRNFITALGAGFFSSPASVVAAPNGSLYVGDVSHIVPLTTGGAAGTPFGTLNSPFGITADAASNIFVADTGNNRIVSFSSTGTPGLTISSANGVNFNHPYGVAVDASHIYVSDTFNDRIAIFDTAGNYQSSFSTNVSTLVPAWQYFHPLQTAIASNGTIFATLDSGYAAFSSTGQLLDNYGFLDRPSAMAMYGSTLYAVEIGPHLVHVFQTPEPASLALLAVPLLLLLRKSRPSR